MMDFSVGQFVHCNNDANAQNRTRQCYCSLKLVLTPWSWRATATHIVCLPHLIWFRSSAC